MLLRKNDDNCIERIEHQRNGTIQHKWSMTESSWPENEIRTLILSYPFKHRPKKKLITWKGLSTNSGIYNTIQHKCRTKKCVLKVTYFFAVNVKCYEYKFQLYFKTQNYWYHKRYSKWFGIYTYNHKFLFFRSVKNKKKSKM